jgi:pyrroline-5-carboxylate reductase
MTALRELRIGFVGGGNMAQAIVGGLLRAGHLPGAISIAEPAEAQREQIAGLGNVRLARSNTDVACESQVLVLAVKPQVMPAVLPEIASARRPADQLVVSLAAGVTLATIAGGLKTASVVRVMPNQPALIGEGISALPTQASFTRIPVAAD